MNPDSPDSDPVEYPEINRAATAGLCLVGSRRHFRRLALDAMDAFVLADQALRETGFHFDHPPVFRAFDTAHSAHAFFIYETELRWDAEDGIPEKPPRYHRRPTDEHPERNRLDDILDGYIGAPDSEVTVESVFEQCARAEYEEDPVTSKRLLCIAQTWAVDLTHCREQPDWASRQGVFPGAEAAPTLACLFLQLARRHEHYDSKPARALRLAALAAGRIRPAAYAYGRAACADFEYATAVGGE